MSWESKWGETNIFHVKGGWSEETASSDGGWRLLDNNFLFSKIIFLTSFEQSRTTIDFSSKRMFVTSEQTKSLSKPRKDGFIARLNRLTRTSLTKDKDPEGMSPDSTIFSESFCFDKLLEEVLL